MTNTNCLEGIACPACGNDFMIYIEARTMAAVTDDGSETFGDMEWDASSYTECPDCGRSGTLSEFRVGLAKGNANNTGKENRP
jgi:hypothetical protein